jgi:hypothetical protein
LIAIECGIVVVSAAVAVISTHHRVSPAAQGLLLGAAAGALFGVSDIAIKFPRLWIFSALFRPHLIDDFSSASRQASCGQTNRS